MKLSTRNLLPTLLGCLLAVPAAAWAFGLGEITLQSALGQPLKASIPILAGPDEAFEESCFQARADHDSGLPGVAEMNLVLQGQKDDARLLLTSRHPVNEPAVAISVITDCPQRLARQYVVLLDPPVMLEAPVLPQAAAQQAARSPYSEPHSARAAKTARRRTAARSSVQPARTHIYHATQAPHTGSSAPRLLLSGRSHAIVAVAPSFGLRMDASLPAPGKYQDAPPTATEMSDENASLSHKLAYLEQQLTSLQRRNAELELVSKTRAPPAPAQPSAADVKGRQGWLAALALLAAGALLAWRWRRQRQAAVKPYPEATLWTPPAEATRPGLPLKPFAESTEAQTALQAVSLAAAKPPELPAPAPRPPAPTPIVTKWLEKSGVEVDDSVVDEVEVFMAHGHAELAINLLEEHLRIAPDESPIPWMLLLDLLKRQKLAAQYEEAGKACKQYFNIRIPELYEDEPGPGAAGLEAYPHILAELTRLWNTTECEAYLDDMIFDRRGGSRVGFDPPTYREIMLLRTLQGDDTSPAAARFQAY